MPAGPTLLRKGPRNLEGRLRPPGGSSLTGRQAGNRQELPLLQQVPRASCSNIPQAHINRMGQPRRKEARREGRPPLQTEAGAGDEGETGRAA